MVTFIESLHCQRLENLRVSLAGLPLPVSLHIATAVTVRIIMPTESRTIMIPNDLDVFKLVPACRQCSLPARGQESIRAPVILPQIILNLLTVFWLPVLAEPDSSSIST